MANETCCGGQQAVNTEVSYETVRIEKVRNVCPMCEDYARHQAAKPVVVMSCEGACLRGEIARQAANCHHRCYKSLYQRNKMSPLTVHLLYLQRDHCSGGVDAQKGGLDGHQGTC